MNEAASAVEARPTRMPYLPKETYSPCRCCGQVFVRVDLLGITVKGWEPCEGKPDQLVEVKLRLCRSCWDEEMAALKAIAWKHEHLSGERLNAGAKFLHPHEDPAED